MRDPSPTPNRVDWLLLAVFVVGALALFVGLVGRLLPP
jgi:hypothetical protein